MKKSKFLKLDWMDLLKGAVVATGTAVALSVKPIVMSGRIPTKEELIGSGVAGVTALGAYLFKNLFTNSNDELLKAEK